ncbi:response regulator transcription factor [Glaciecola sp. SC05]|uniref:response regulator transcription factor n=1 Tax=Glaciecola sp. SC05 TaxID=1987355 RepID=UPI003528C1E1
MKILLVEDDAPLARALKESLVNQQHSVTWVASGELALNSFREHSFELVILDLGLPDMDGMQVLKVIKTINAKIPVLILTARDGTEHKVEGLDLGADDYLSKPFDMPELLARLRVIERRFGTAVSAVITIANVSIDTAASSIEVDGQSVALSRREWMIIKLLMESAGRVLSKDTIEARLYDWGEEIASNTIEVHISNLRKKLPTDFIQTLRGVGYVVKKPA